MRHLQTSLLITVSVCGLALAACSPKPAETSADNSQASKPEGYGYDVALTFTPAAAAKVAQRGDKVTIAALYYGNATPASVALADAKDGTIHLTTDLVETDASDHPVHMTGAGANVPNLQYITQKKPLVQLNIYASKAGKKDPVIACSVFQDYVASAQLAPVAIHCDVA